MVEYMKLLKIILVFIILILFIRVVSERQIDDVSPEIQCDAELLEKSDVFYVIPMFNNKSIADNQTWCQDILAMNKTLAMHGVYHTFEEFKEPRSEEYLQIGIVAFENCFNQTPVRFKPPQVVISKENMALIRRKMKLDTYAYVHKNYHCNDTGVYPNWFRDLI
jgi:hypothetical protein